MRSNELLQEHGFAPGLLKKLATESEVSAAESSCLWFRCLKLGVTCL